MRAALASGYLHVDLERGTITGRDGRPRPGRDNGRGYLQVSVGSNRLASIHRIVWIAAHGAISAGLTINHLNGNKADNRLVNLEVKSSGDNTRLHWRGDHRNHPPHPDDAPPIDGELLASAQTLARSDAPRREVAAFMRDLRQRIEAEQQGDAPGGDT